MSGIGWFFLVLVLACWIYIIGHQLGISGFDPRRYPALEVAVPIAYTGAAISLCFVAAIIVMIVKTRESE